MELIKMHINIMVLILEACVIGFEYMFYVSKYEDISKIKLLLFTITANAVSWGAYALFTSYFS